MKEIANLLLKIYGLLYKRFGPRHWWPGDSQLEIIIGAILTQNTNWSNVEKAIKNLKGRGYLSIEKLSQISERALGRLIRPSGYYNIKAKRLKNFIEFLNSHYKGSLKQMFRRNIKDLREELLRINGIGEETADSILLYAGNKKTFVVDAYTKRILRRHGFIKDDFSYSDIQNIFTKNLKGSVQLWNEFHALFVELGKNICRTKRPLCNVCPIRRINYGRRKGS